MHDAFRLKVGVAARDEAATNAVAGAVQRRFLEVTRRQGTISGPDPGPRTVSVGLVETTTGIFSPNVCMACTRADSPTGSVNRSLSTASLSPATGTGCFITYGWIRIAFPSVRLFRGGTV